jgi:hypothetical protein
MLSMFFSDHSFPVNTRIRDNCFIYALCAQAVRVERQPASDDIQKQCDHSIPLQTAHGLHHIFLAGCRLGNKPRASSDDHQQPHSVPKAPKDHEVQ